MRRVVEAALDPRPLLGDDLVELAPDVAEDVAQPVALEHLLAPALEPLHQVAQAGHVAAGRVAGPPAALHQPAERLGEVALGHHVVGERVEDLVGVEVGDVLACRPSASTGRARASASAADSASATGRTRACRVRRQIAWIRRTSAVTGGRPSRRARGPC